MLVIYGYPVNETDWESRIATAWESFEDYDETEFLALIEKLAAERPAGDSVAFFDQYLRMTSSTLRCRTHWARTRAAIPRISTANSRERSG